MDRPEFQSSQVIGSKRKVTHVSKACDRCRKRKIKCNGAQPTCDVCMVKGSACKYECEDGRRNNAELADLRERLFTLERLLSGPTSSGKAPVESSSTAESRPSGSSTSLRERVRPRSGPSTQPKRTSKSASTLARTSHDMQTETVPAGTTSLTAEKNHFDRLKRSNDGLFIHYGPTSLWMHSDDVQVGSAASAGVSHLANTATSGSGQDSDSTSSVIGAPIPMASSNMAWSRDLPPGVPITKQIHDQAINFFAAYYAPWCMVADMPSFYRDLDRCNPSISTSTSAASCTTAYPPLLHNTILYLGMFMLRERWPDAMKALEGVFGEHCAKLCMIECEQPSLSSIRGLNLLASCQNMQMRPPPAHNRAYIYFGLAYAAVAALGLDLDCEPYVKRGRMTREEKDMRAEVFWAMYLQDVLRAIAAGRPPMLATHPDIQMPPINASADMVPWVHSPQSSLNKVGAPDSRTSQFSMNGLPGMRSTVLHWTSRIGILLRAVMDTMYSTHGDDSRRDEAVLDISDRLDEWQDQVPATIRDAASYPLPHVLLMHMMYHLTTILLHRPFYRTSQEEEEEEEADETENHDEASGTSAPERCGASALAINDLLELYENNHGVQNAPMTLIQVIYTAATIFLLRAVGDGSLDLASPGSREALRHFDACVSYMRKLGSTWHEGARGMEVLLSLRTEWLPQSPSVSPNGQDRQAPHPGDDYHPHPPPTERYDGKNTTLASASAPDSDEPGSVPGSVVEYLDDLARQLHDFLTSCDYYCII